jgi:hypothetical protein
MVYGYVRVQVTDSGMNSTEYASATLRNVGGKRGLKELNGSGGDDDDGGCGINGSSIVLDNVSLYLF